MSYVWVLILLVMQPFEASHVIGSVVSAPQSYTTKYLLTHAPRLVEDRVPEETKASTVTDHPVGVLQVSVVSCQNGVLIGSSLASGRPVQRAFNQRFALIAGVGSRRGK